MDLALAQLALVFLPGIIWANIDAKYGAGLKPNQTTLILRSFMFGVATYASLYLIYSCLGKTFGYEGLDSTVDAFRLTELVDEIIFAIPMSFVLTIAWLFCVRYRFL